MYVAEVLMDRHLNLSCQMQKTHQVHDTVSDGSAVWVENGNWVDKRDPVKALARVFLNCRESSFFSTATYDLILVPRIGVRGEKENDLA